jgi:hypothetical protein
VKIVDVNERLPIRRERTLQRREVFVREPVAARGRGGKFALPVVNALETVMDGTKDDEARKLVLERFGQRDCLCDVVVGGDRIRPLDFQVRRVSQFRLFIQADESGQRRAGCKNIPLNFLVQRPTNSSMNTLAFAVGGVVVNGTLEAVLFLSTTCLKRVKSGGLATLTGPFSSPATRP